MMTPPPQVPYIGSTISLLSKANIRYEGFLYTIDQKESSVALSHVKVFGTEDRQCERPVPPSDEVFEFIIFRASDITELKVIDTPPSRASVPDPAIIRAQNKAPSGSSKDKENHSSSVKEFFSQVGQNESSDDVQGTSRNSRPPLMQNRPMQTGGFQQGSYRNYNNNKFPPRQQQNFYRGSYRSSHNYNRNFGRSYGPPGHFQQNNYRQPRQNYQQGAYGSYHPMYRQNMRPFYPGPHEDPRRNQSRPVMHFRRVGQPQWQQNSWNNRRYGNNNNGWNRGFYQAPVDPIPARFTADYDFEAANREMEMELSKLLNDGAFKFIGYNKEKSFYDDISRVRGEGEDEKAQVRKESARQASLNRETFGLVRGRMRPGFGAQRTHTAVSENSQDQQ